MAFFPDLGTETQIACGPLIRAIGWLDERPFASGHSPKALADRLALFRENWGYCVDALRWPVAGGGHTCDWCGTHGDSANIAVPGVGVLYVAPGMVGHYVRDHSYLPPEEFIEAVLSAPLPGSSEYFVATAPFHPELSSRDERVHQMAAQLRVHLGRRRVTFSSRDLANPAALWLLLPLRPGLERRARVEAVSDSTWQVVVGRGSFDDGTDFVGERTLTLSTREILVLGEQLFPPPPEDRARRRGAV